MRAGRKTSFAAGAIAALVIGSGTAFAATGGKLILGYGNSASRTTTLSNPNGSAMSFSSKAGTPSIRVNRNTRVPNLNADLIDGLDQSQLALAAGNVKVYDFPAEGFDMDGNMTFETFVASGTCPIGTRRTGGGVNDMTSTGAVFRNGPDVSGQWTVAAIVDPSVDHDPAKLVASVVCFSPRGVPADGYRTTAPASAPSPQTLASIKTTVLAKLSH